MAKIDVSTTERRWNNGIYEENQAASEREREKDRMVNELIYLRSQARSTHNNDNNNNNSNNHYIQ